MISLGRRRSGQIGAIALLCTVATVAACQLGIESMGVRDAAMAPSLVPGQQVLIQRLGGSERAEPGDLVVMRTPDAPEVLYIKRLIAGPGDVVRVSDGRAILVPDGQYFALADNRAGSFDSHQGWFVSADDLVARVVVSYWPPTAAGLVLPHAGPEIVADAAPARGGATRS